MSEVDIRMWLLRPPGVYRPQGDTWLLAKALRHAGASPGGAVLDIGCGTGALSVLAAAHSPRSVTAVDVSNGRCGPPGSTSPSAAWMSPCCAATGSPSTACAPSPRYCWLLAARC
jgi:hypothetical protein